MPKQISVEGNGHCCHRPSSNWETKPSLYCLCIRVLWKNENWNRAI